MYSQDIYFKIIGSCFLGSFFFSLAETTLLSLTPLQAEQFASEKGWLKRSLRYWIRQPNRLLTATLVGNTFVNTTAATLLASYMANYYPQVSITVVTLLLTFVLLVFGEIIPKIVGRAYSEKLAPSLCRMLIGINYLLYPFTYALSALVSFVLSALGLIATQHPRVIKPADIEQMIRHVSRVGSMEEDKTKILSSVFAFSKRRVKDIMVPRDKISAISVDANLMEVLDTVRHENHSRYPVYNGTLEKIVGFFHARDLFGILKSYGFQNEDQPTPLPQFSLRTCLRKAFFISEQAMISRVLNDMKANRIHLAIVKDEWGNVVGLVTLEDILEEVFGEIEDEHDEYMPTRIIDLYASGVEVEGSELIVDLKTKYGINLEESDAYATLNGFLQHYASHQYLTPKTVIIWKNYVFSILNVRDGEIEKVKITEIPEE